MNLSEARAYVGTDEICGRAQLEILRREGLTPSCNVLEIGCGCLSAGVPVMEFLRDGKYVGIEPNRWLIDAAMQEERIRSLVSKSRPTFLGVSDFDASDLDLKFHFILSHSVLSHCAEWQVPLFLCNAARVLHDSGKIAASFRMSEGNDFGSPGTHDGKDTRHQEWQYPDVSWYSQHTMSSAAYRSGLLALLRPKHTRYLTSIVPKDVHDWMVFQRPTQ